MGTQLREASPASATRRPRPASRPSRSRARPTSSATEIAAAAKRLNELREGWLNPPGLDEEELKSRTLTNLYNERPTWLRDAHERLDRAVLAAYGWPADITNDDLLARLLALNLERARDLTTLRMGCMRMILVRNGTSVR